MRILHTLALDLAGTRRTRRRPSGLLGLVHKATGFFEKELEEEVQTMVELLDRVHAALAKVGIDNLVRLVVDSEVVYEDLKQKPNDLETAATRAVEHGLGGARRLELVLEHEVDELYLILRIDVYREHETGAFPIWVRTCGLPTEFLRRKRERRDLYRKRVAERIGDHASRVALEGTGAAALDAIVVPLERALRKGLEVKSIQADRTWRLFDTEEDYFFALRHDTFEALETARAAALEAYPDPETRPAQPLPQFAEEGQEILRKMERKLRRGRSAGSVGALSWSEFSRKKVYNPATGKLAQIRNLAPGDRARYQALFNSQTIDPEAQVEVYTPPSVFERMVSTVQRGVTATVDATMGKLRKDAPRTAAFIDDTTYRKAVLTESGVLLGKGLYDQADILAHTIVGEIYETARLPLAWVAGSTKMTMDEKDLRRQDEAMEQILDLTELATGTIVPVACYAVGGALGGVLGLAGIFAVQKALNWHSKRSGGREWSIRPSRMIERQAEVKAKRQPERSELMARLEQIRRRHEGDVSEDDLSEEGRRKIESELADTFREFGKMLEEERVEFEDGDLDLESVKESDLLAAMEDEARATREARQEKKGAG